MRTAHPSRGAACASVKATLCPHPTTGPRRPKPPAATRTRTRRLAPALPCSTPGPTPGRHTASFTFSTTISTMNNVGLNICGCVKGAHGIAEAMRGFIRGTAAAQIPYVINNLEFDEEPHGTIWRLGEFTRDNPHPINLLYFNPELMKRYFPEAYGEKYLQHRYNIAYWYWETNQLKKSWLRHRPQLDEVWAGSEFCRNVFEDQMQLPSVTIPPVVEPAVSEVAEPPIPIPRDTMVFMACYDYRSCAERKNPRGTIEAFRRAFPRQNDVMLILKARSGNLTRTLRRQHRKVKRMIRGILPPWTRDRRIVLEEQFLSPGQMNGLMARCDCLISLHRCEGFGLHMAEAMYQEKPVIATGYSGNMDFMNADNSYLVGHRLVPIQQRDVPYPRGSVWAEPDLDHAAELMRRVYTHRQEAAEKGAEAARTIRRNHSVQAAGNALTKHVYAVSQRRAA